MDHLGKVDDIKFRDKIKLGSEQHPRISSRSQYDAEKEAVVLHIPKRFFLDLRECHENTGFSYTSIVNAHVNIITIHQTERLEEHLRKTCSGIRSAYRELQQKAGQERRDAFLTQERKISLKRSEVLNANDLVISNIRYREELVELRKQYDVVLSSLQTAVKTVELRDKDIEKLKAKNASLAEHIQEKFKVKDPTNKGRPIYGEDPVEYRQRKRKLDTLQYNVNSTLWFAKSFGLVPEVLKLRSTCGSKTVKLDLQRKTGDPVAPKYDDLSATDQERIQQLVLILDKFGVGETAYHELRMIGDDELPTSTLIAQCRKDLNKLTEIKRLGGDKPGAYVSFSTEIGKLIKENPDNVSPRIKFCGDGTKVSRIKNYVVFSYNNIDGNGSHKLLGILQGSEDYELMKRNCLPILNEVNDVLKDGITFEGTHYTPHIFLGGDLKFLLTVLGMNVSCGSANYSCPFCKVHKDNRGDVTKSWDFYHGSDLRRDYTNFCEVKDGQKYQPLIRIHTDFIVPCLLHCLLRVMDRLEKNLVLEMVQRDIRAKIDCQPQEYLKRLVDLIRDCGVTYNVWESKNDKKGTKHERTALTGGDKLKVLEHLPEKLRSSDILHEDTKEAICSLWENFLTLYTSISHCSPEDAEHVFNTAREWVQSYQSIGKDRFGYSAGKTTPYMHILVYHCPYYISKYGGLAKLSGQGMEKLNDKVKFIHHRRTSRWDGERDALAVGKRMEALEGKARVKRPYNLTEEGRAKIQATRKAKRQAIHEAQRPSQPIEEPADERDLTELSAAELKEILKTFGVKTRVRTPSKLINMIEQERAKLQQ